MSLLLLLVGAKRGGGSADVQPSGFERFRREDDEILTLIMIAVESGILDKGEIK